MTKKVPLWAAPRKAKSQNTTWTEKRTRQKRRSSSSPLAAPVVLFGPLRQLLRRGWSEIALSLLGGCSWSAGQSRGSLGEVSGAPVSQPRAFPALVSGIPPTGEAWRGDRWGPLKPIRSRPSHAYRE